MLGIILDGIPESLVLGLTVLEAGAVSAALLVADLPFEPTRGHRSDDARFPERVGVRLGSCASGCSSRSASA